MANFRNVSEQRRRVSYGLPSAVTVEPGQVLQVPDEVAESYACQAIWEPVAKSQKTPPAETGTTPSPEED